MQDFLRRVACLVRVNPPTTASAATTMRDRPVLNALVATLATFMLVTASLARQANVASATLMPSCEDAVRLASERRSEETDRSSIYCVGYVAAVREAESLRFVVLGAEAAFCVDRRVSHEQVARAFLEYISLRPEQLQEPARITMRSALAEKFPCP